MKSVTVQEPGIPAVYCQQTESNQVLCSLMSSVLQRDTRSKRFDRNQRREMVVKDVCMHGAKVRMRTPQGPFRSKIMIVVLLRDDQDKAQFLESTVSIATNRGYTVAGVAVPSSLKLSQLRLALMALQEQNSGSEIFLCLSNGAWLGSLTKSHESGGELHVGGWFVFGDELNMDTLRHLAAPSLVVTNNSDLKLTQAAKMNACILLVKIPREDDPVALTAAAQSARWMSRCLIEFCEAESARRRHSRPLPIYSKL